MGEHLDSAARDDRGADTTGVTAAGDGLSAERVDELFSVLASARRRRVLDYLRASGPSAGIDELAAEIASGDDGPDATAREDRRRAYISLYHRDLPKMADAGLVSVDAANETVTLADGLGPIETYLGLADRAEPADD